MQHNVSCERACKFANVRTNVLTMNQSSKRPRNKRITPLNHEPAALAWAINKSGFSQAQVIAELAAIGHPISKGQLSEIVKGTRNCRQPTLEAIARVLNCPVVVLERKREQQEAA